MSSSYGNLGKLACPQIFECTTYDDASSSDGAKQLTNPLIMTAQNTYIHRPPEGPDTEPYR